MPLIERFRDRLPVTAATPVVSLGEGSTPLLAAPRLSRAAGIAELWLKWEASNPTGSYKDRGMTVAVSKAVEEGAAAVICASTGNTAATAAAYAARAGIPAVVLDAAGRGRRREARADAHARRDGARGARATSTQALAAAQELADRGSHVLVNSLNPHRRAGQKTAVLEIVEELGGAPDAFVLPYGGGGNTTAVRGRRSPSWASRRRSSRSRRPTAGARSPPRSGSATPSTPPRVDETGARVVAVADEEIVERLARARRRGGGLLRAVLGRRPRRPAPRRRRGRPRRRDDHRPRAQGPGERRPARAAGRPGRARRRRDRRRGAR